MTEAEFFEEVKDCNLQYVHGFIRQACTNYCPIAAVADKKGLLEKCPYPATYHNRNAEKYGKLLGMDIELIADIIDGADSYSKYRPRFMELIKK